MADVPSVFRVFVPVADSKKADDFYQRLFNTEGRLIHGGRRYFDCGPVIFAVIENNGTPIGDHIYFAVADLESVFARAKELDCLEDDNVHGAPRARSPFGRGASGHSIAATPSATAFVLSTKRPCSQE